MIGRQTHTADNRIDIIDIGTDNKNIIKYNNNR